MKAHRRTEAKGLHGMCIRKRRRWVRRWYGKTARLVRCDRFGFAVFAYTAPNPVDALLRVVKQWDQALTPEGHANAREARAYLNEPVCVWVLPWPVLRRESAK